MAEKRKYRIISKGGVGELSILDAAGEFVTVFSYGGWFSSSGSAPTSNGTVRIQPASRDRESFVVRRGRKHTGEIFFLEKGKLKIILKDRAEKIRTFSLIQPARTSGWVLTDDKHRKVLTMRSPSHWADADQQFEVSVQGAASVDEEMLLITCGYATNLNNTKVMALKA